jgi:enoyl-CoA hydratase/carnithine racemase
MMTSITQLPQPVIARVHGLATAAGCQLVAACDLAVASVEAKFQTPGVSMGAFCATPSVALGRNVARKHAMEMLLTAELVTAERAAEIGLVNRVVSHDRLIPETAQLAALLATKSAAAMASGKRVFYEQLTMPLEDAYRFASHAIACDFLAADGQEGVDAFLSKRVAHFPSNNPSS